MGPVGVVAHSGSAQDVRRLTSLARTVDVHERVNVLARVLAGIGASSSAEVLHLSEPTRLVERATAALRALGDAPRPECRPANAVPAVDARGTRAAVGAMRDAGAACLVTLGGDGTNRAVAAAWPEALLVPLPGGTNNAFATDVDPTAAGMAAGIVAEGRDSLAGGVRRTPRISVAVEGRPPEIALIDIVLVRDEWLGAHAIWDPGRLVEAVVTRADPACPGLCGVAGMLAPDGMGAAGGLHLRFGPRGRPVVAPLGPGRLVPVPVEGVRPLARGEAISLRGPGALALDGERELLLAPGERATVSVAPEGPWVLDVGRLLRARAERADLRVPDDQLDPARPIPGGH